MKIDSISSSYQSHGNDVKVKSNESRKKEEFSDKLTLSKEAIQMTKERSESRAAYLEEIKSRVKNGYYDQNNVIDKVADSILTSDDLHA